MTGVEANRAATWPGRSSGSSGEQLGWRPKVPGSMHSGILYLGVSQCRQVLSGATGGKRGVHATNKKHRWRAKKNLKHDIDLHLLLEGSDALYSRNLH